MTRSRAVTLIVPAAILIVCATGVASAWSAPFGAPHPAAGTSASGLTGWIFAEQAAFYRSLSGFIRAAKEDGAAMWELFGISFAYGVFHAVGPGHGKAVISSYLVANDETWRRGVVLSFVSAAMQSVVAIVVVAIAAVLLGATAKAIGLTVHLVEIVSYALVVLIGLRLLYVKGHGFLNRLARIDLAPVARSRFCIGSSCKEFKCRDLPVVGGAARCDRHARRAMPGRWMHRSRTRVPVPARS
jgi:nickel/cobalt transporter (NicO) family protein